MEEFPSTLWSYRITPHEETSRGRGLEESATGRRSWEAGIPLERIVPSMQKDELRSVLLAGFKRKMVGTPMECLSP